MAGRPFLQTIIAEIERRGAEEYGEDTPPGMSPGEAYVFGRIAEGESQTAIAKSLDCSRRMIRFWIDQDKTRRDGLLEEARRMSAEAHAEDAGEVLDTLERDGIRTPAQVSLAKERANYRKWMAGVRDPGTFGDKSGVNVSLNIDDLYLQALQAKGRVQHIEEADVEVIEEGDDTKALPTHEDEAA